MVICKFFLQGTCKFGNSCRYEHQLDNSQGTSILKQQTGQNSNRNPTMDPNSLIQSVINDMMAVEHGKQWLFSSYSPFKDKPTFPGFEDKSFEEIRLGFYEANKQGTLEHYKQTVQMWYQEALARVKTLQNPNQEIIKLLTQIYNTQTPFQNTQNTFSSNSILGNSVFGNKQNNSIFGQNQNQSNNVFTNTPFQNSPFQSQNVFNRNVNSNNVFTQNNGNNVVFGNNSIFNNQFQQNSNLTQNNLPQNNLQPNNIQQNFQNTQSNYQNTQSNFQNANLQNNFQNSNLQQNNLQNPNLQQNNLQNSFGNGQNQSPFSQASIFQNVQSTIFNNRPNNANVQTVFNNQNSIFGNSILNKNTETSQNDVGVYSKLEDLSEEDIKWFQSDEFEFKKIPEKPPTLEMCKS